MIDSRVKLFSERQSPHDEKFRNRKNIKRLRRRQTTTHRLRWARFLEEVRTRRSSQQKHSRKREKFIDPHSGRFFSFLSFISMRFTTNELQLAFTNISSSLLCLYLLSLSLAMSVGRLRSKQVSESLAAPICEYVSMSLTIIFCVSVSADEGSRQSG